MLHQGLGTMVAGADGDAQAVEQCTEVQVMNALDVESHHSTFILGFTVELHTFDATHLLHGQLRQRMFVRGNGLHSDVRNILQRHSQGVRSHIIGCSGFKLIGQPLISGFFKRNTRNHFATALIGRHAVEQ